MHRRSSGSPVEDDAEDSSLVSRPPITPVEDHTQVSNVSETPDKSRSQVATRGTSFDLRRDNGSSTPRSRNSTVLWRTLSSSSSSLTNNQNQNQPAFHDTNTNTNTNNTNTNPNTTTPPTKPPIMMPLFSSSASSSPSSSSQRLPMRQPSPEEGSSRLRHARRPRSPWSCSILTVLLTFVASFFLISILRSFGARQVGSNGCGIPVMSPTFIRMVGFDTEHTRFASKYNLYLYREEGVDPYNKENIGVRPFSLLFIGWRVFLLTLVVERCASFVFTRKCR